MPTYIDTFGYSFLEAMAHGIPCIGTRHFAVPEIVENEVTGLLVKPPLSYFDPSGMGHPEIQIERADTSETTAELATAMNKLIESESLRDRMGAESSRSVLSGKFSIPYRNRLLKAVYEESINR
jgi:glycosyltransferase involved in cell wall biosynthesis